MSFAPRDRILGCLIGGALGDAWGSPYEGASPPLAVDDWPTGSPTDDTELTLATCEAIVSADGADPAAIAERMRARFRAGAVVGVGASTLKALRDLDCGAHWALAGARGERTAGNGAAMRIAPLAFVLDPDSRAGRQRIRDVARITHHHDEAYAGALAVVLAIRLAASGSSASAASLVARVADQLPDCAVRDRLALLATLAADASPLAVAARFGASGHVVDSVPLALFAAQALACSSFEAVIRDTIRAGGDTDTIAAITGQIAGAACGFDRLPKTALKRVRGLESLLERLEPFARRYDRSRLEASAPGDA